MNRTACPPVADQLAESRPEASRIPPPRVKWVSRVVIPAGALLAVAALLAWATRDAWLPARTVQAVSVMILPADVPAAGSPGPAAAAAAGAEPPAAASPAPPAEPGPILAQASGWIEPDPYPTYVTALAGGIIETIHVLEGDQVQPGQRIATLVDEDARLADDHAAAAVDAAQAQLQSAQARLSAARRDWKHPIDQVRAVETTAAQLAETRAELARLDSRIRREQALLDDLQAVRTSVEEAFADRAATEVERDRTRLQVDAQAAQLASIRELQPVLAARVKRLTAELHAAREDRRLRIAEKRELDEAEAAVAAAQAALAQARARRAETQLRLKRMTVVAPSRGRVMRLLKAPGDKLMVRVDNPRSAQVAGLYDPNDLQVRVDVPLADAAKVHLGQPATVVADTLPDETFRGQVTRIVREADIQKNTLEVKVAIDQPEELLTPEVLARVKFHAEPSRTVARSEPASQRLFVPADLVGQGPGGPFVFIVDELSKSARRRQVTLGARRDDWLQVRTGLRPGDRLVAAPPDELSDGQRLRIRGQARVEDGSE